MSTHMTTAERLLREAVPHAEWREKRIHVCGGPVLQHWKLDVYLPIPAESDMSPEQALDHALADGRPTYAELVKALRSTVQQLTDFHLKGHMTGWDKALADSRTLLRRIPA
jgi:hypothetical protein